MGVYINMEKPKECDGIGINIHFTDGHMELHILDECELIEIVRCGECKHHDEDGWGYGNCQRPSVDYLRTADDDFCSYGERRADGDI